MRDESRAAKRGSEPKPHHQHTTFSPGFARLALRNFVWRKNCEVLMEKQYELNGTRADALAVTPAYGTKLVTGVFPDRASAELAYNAVTHRGYGTDEVNLVMSDATRKLHFARSGAETELGTRASEGAGVGGVIGAGIGAVAATFAAIGASLIVPGIGLVVAGPIAAALAGVGAGGIAGGLVGALVGWGMPEERLKHYQDAVEGGGILIGVNPRNDDDAAYFESTWKDSRGTQINR